MGSYTTVATKIDFQRRITSFSVHIVAADIPIITIREKITVLNTRSLISLTLAITSVIALSGCVSDPEVRESPSSLIRTTSFESSNTCPAGGLLVETGLDTNNDGQLQNSEVLSSHEVCNGISQCTWMDNQDGTTTVTCQEGIEHTLLNPDTLEFSETIRCNISIDKAGTESEKIPMSYTIDKIGPQIKFVTLTIFDNETQFSNSRVLTDSHPNFEISLINVFYDNYEEANGGRFFALIREPDDEVTFLYRDIDLIDENDNPDGLVGGTFPAFGTESDPGACIRPFTAQ